jgi:ABC-type amino acid transport substrate-binding protein
MIISAITGSEDKEELADFSDPYYIMEYILITLSEAELILREDLKNKKIGMLANKPEDLPAQYLKDFAIEVYSDVILMIEGLKNKDIEGMLISIPLGKNIIEENNGLFSIIEIVKSEREYNIVFIEGSPLKDEVNSILEEMQADGTYQEIHDKWFAIIK